MEVVYGPVSSWRLGRSLGIDPICSERKVCSFDCIYCSLGRTERKTVEREVYVPADLLEEELKRALRVVKADVVTFSGTGEPTLARNLGELIDRVREICDLPVAVLSNSSTWMSREVRRDLLKADIVKGKVDAPRESVFTRITRPHESIRLTRVLQGIRKLREEFSGKLAIEVMFVKENKDFAEELASLLREIAPDEVQINTPLRPSSVPPLSRRELRGIERSFQDLPFISVYRASKPAVASVVGRKKLRKLKRTD